MSRRIAWPCGNSTLLSGRTCTRRVTVIRRHWLGDNLVLHLLSADDQLSTNAGLIPKVMRFG